MTPELSFQKLRWENEILWKQILRKSFDLWIDRQLRNLTFSSSNKPSVLKIWINDKYKIKPILFQDHDWIFFSFFEVEILERYKQNLNLTLNYSPESEALLLTPIVHCVSHQSVTTCPPKIFLINHYQSVLIDLISIIQKLDLKSESTHALQILEFSSNVKGTLPRAK